MNKVAITWPKRWWAGAAHLRSLAIASAHSTPASHPWPWFISPANAPNTLICLVTGAFAERIEDMKNDAIANEVIAVLKRAFPTRVIPAPSHVRVTRWRRDPFARGSWTYFAVGSRPEHAHAALASPLGSNGQVTFAGEHTRVEDMGTVHGAWLSGERAASELISARGKA